MNRPDKRDAELNESVASVFLKERGTKNPSKKIKGIILDLNSQSHVHFQAEYGKCIIPSHVLPLLSISSLQIHFPSSPVVFHSPLLSQ